MFRFFQRKGEKISDTLSYGYQWISHLGSGDLYYQNPLFNSEGSKRVQIYCVHGTFDNPSAFRFISEALINKGLPDFISSIQLVAFDGRYKGNSIDYFAKQLIKKIKKNGDRDIILLGHSRGGLVVSHAAEYYAIKNDINVRKIVTLCTPFAGSTLAITPLSWFSTSVAEMQIDCPYLEGLGKKIEQSDYDYFFYGARNDWVVNPLYTFVLNYLKKHPCSFKICDAEDHLSILYSKEISQSIFDMVLSLPMLHEMPKLEKSYACL